MFQVACFAVTPTKTDEVNPFWAYANLTVASFKRLDPKTRALLLTVKKSKIPKGLLFDKVCRSGNIRDESQRLMMDELLGWLDFVRSDLFDRPTVLIDPDLLYQNNLMTAFQVNFDIGLTWRNVLDAPEPTEFSQTANRQPYNAGVIFLNPQRKDRVIYFFEACLSELSCMDEKYWGWFGDQEAIINAAGRQGHLDFEPQTWEHGGVKFQSFPSDIYNYSQPWEPSGQYQLIHFPSPSIIHFKGERAKLMFRYAEEFLNMRFHPDRKSPGGMRIMS